MDAAHGQTQKSLFFLLSGTEQMVDLVVLTKKSSISVCRLGSKQIVDAGVQGWTLVSVGTVAAQ